MTRTSATACGGVGGAPCPSDGQTSIHVEPGIAPLGVSIGGYFNPRLALLLRLAGTSYFRGNSQIVQTFAGPVVEVWPHDRWFLGGGVGLATFGPNPFLGASAVSTDHGVAFDLRAGAVLLGGARHALTLSLEIIPGIYRRTRVGGALVVAWKWY